VAIAAALLSGRDGTGTAQLIKAAEIIRQYIEDGLEKE
jgi:hypothetical protein